jgi:RNA polymerase sigma-70 factor (ECF subfamily)
MAIGPMAELSDEELVARYRSATGPAAEALLNQLFERHHSRVAAWCYRITGNIESAADYAQDVFLKALQHLDSFRAQSKFTTWLYSIARNHCFDAMKAQAAAAVQPGESALEQVEDLNADFAATFDRREAEEVVRQLIRESLDETETKVMTLHYVNEVPLDAVTRLLGLSNASGAKAYVVSARRKLARAFERRSERSPRKAGGNG